MSAIRTIGRLARPAAGLSACLATGALLFAVPTVQGSCLPLTTQEKIQRADAVFVGRVLSVRERCRTASFRVLSVRKGSVRRGSVVRVTADLYPSSVTIDWRPRVGQRWRVFADREARRWWTNDCDGTHRL